MTSALWTHLVKDLRIEWRSLDAIVSMLFFSGLVVVLFLREDPLRRTHALDPESGEEDSEAGPAQAAGAELRAGAELGIGPELQPEAETVA